MPERRSQLKSFVTRSRCCKDLVGVIYAVGGQTKSGNSLSTVEVYDPIAGRWKDAEAMSMLRSRVGVAVMQNRLYAIGGYNGQERLNTVEVFDAQTGRWSKVRGRGRGLIPVNPDVKSCDDDSMTHLQVLLLGWGHAMILSEMCKRISACKLYYKMMTMI